MRLRPLAAILALTLLVAGCSDSGDEPAEESTPAGDAVAPARIDLSVGDLDETLRIGVLVSSGTPGAEGGDVLELAQGVVVARERLAAGGADVELVVRDDRGDAEAARSAVEELANADVLGIVVGTIGDHLGPALEEAAEQDVATILPYEAPATIPDGIWTTAPSAAAVGQRLTEGLASLSFTAPYVVSIDGAEVDGVDAAASSSVTSTGLGAAITGIEQAVSAGTVDSVVIAGPAGAQGQLAAGVHSLSDGSEDGEVRAILPIALTPQAQRPAFAEALTAANGVLGGQFVSAGPDASDTTTLSGGAAGNNAAAFYAALRSAAGDPAVKDLLGGPFDAVADAADISSHDAVVALVRAAVAADSVARADVLAALDGLALDDASGLAGSPLDFSEQAALPTASVVLLVATTNDPGVRPAAPTATAADGTGGLFWFAAPQGG